MRMIPLALHALRRWAASFAIPWIAATPLLAAEPKPIAVASVNRTTPVDFQTEILPLMKANCLACHNKTKAKADLILETPADMVKGGKGGAGLVAGKGAESLILKAAAHELEDSIMPPAGNKVAAVDFTPEQLGLLKLWIDQGASGQVKEAAVQWRPLPAGVQPIYALAVSANAHLAALARGDRIDLLDATTRNTIGSLADPSLNGAAHRDLVNALAFSPDGRMLASGGYREIKLWRKPDPTRRGVPLTADGHDAPCTLSAIHAQTKRLAFAGADGVVWLVDAESLKLVGEFPKLPSGATALRFSPDGARLAAAAGKVIQIWNVADRSAFTQVEAPADVHAIAWVDGGKRLAVAVNGDKAIRLWALPESGGAMPPPQTAEGHAATVVSLDVVAANPMILLSADEAGEARLWNVESLATTRQVSHGGAVVAAALRPDGKRFATAGKDGSLKVWDTADGKMIAEFKSGEEARRMVAQAENVAALAAGDATFRAARVEAAQKREQAESDRVKKVSEALVAAEKRLTTAQAAYVKALADATRAEHEQPPNKATIENAAKARDAAAAERDKARAALAGAVDEVTVASRVASGIGKDTLDARVESWSAQARKVEADAALEAARKTAGEPPKPPRSLAFSPDGQTLAVSYDDGALRLISADSGAAVDRFIEKEKAAFAFVDARRLAVASATGASIWSASQDWTLDRTLGGEGSSEIADRVNALDFSADGRLLAAGGGTPSRSGEILLYDVAAGRLERRFDDVHTDAILSLRFSPDGRRLASGSADRFARIVDLYGASPVRSLEGHTHHVLGVAWRWDGRVIATAGADATVKLWDADTGEKRKNIAGFDKEATAVTFIERSSELLATGGDGRVRRLREDGSEVRAFPAAGDFLYSAALNGPTILAGGQAGALWAWNGEDGKALSEPPAVK